MSYLSDAQRAQFAAMRKALDGFVAKIADNATEVNGNMAAIRLWHPGPYVVGDVRMYAGSPYKCVQGHNSTGNDAWTPADTPALWMQYHGTTPETARPFIRPTGAHDMYRAGEYMIWTDGALKRCIEATTYSPDEYAAAWADG